VLLKIIYVLVRRLLSLAVLVFRGDEAKDAELLVLRHENAVLRRHAGRVRYDPADRVWFAALARLLPRDRWTEVFPVTPATLLAWHRKLAAGKYDTSNRRKPARPPTVPGIARLVVRLAKENPLPGYRRIHGAGQVRAMPAGQRYPCRRGQFAGQGLTATTTSGGKAGGRPPRGRSPRPARRWLQNRLRHLETTWPGVSSRAAISSLPRPSAAYSTIRARATSRYGDVYLRAAASRWRRSSSVRTMRYGLARGIVAPF
jgi:hypothetical protein